MESNVTSFALDSEGPHLEYKSALKGIPSSVWETYSAFANSDGGTIILGVGEDDSGKPFLEGIPKPDVRLQELWNNLNNPQVVNYNILREGDIRIIEIEDVHLIVMNVPRADRGLKPIYYRRLETGTFKRLGEGDYRCNMSEIGSMMRDRSDFTYDTTLIDEMGLGDLDMDSFHSFRTMMSFHYPDHMWNSVGDDEFAEMINVTGRKNSEKPLTVAGLLMFGREHLIYSVFPNFMLDYREYPDDGPRWTFRLNTGEGRWSGNLFNFYRLVSQRFTGDLDRPRDVGRDMRRIDDTDMHMAVRECMLNAMIHADYLGRGGIVIEKRPKSLTVSNPGLFRIPVEMAERGGFSDPRNRYIAKMFSIIGAVERAGSGVSFVFRTWDAAGYGKPMITENMDVQNVTFTLPLWREIHGSDELLELINSEPRISMAEMSRRTGLSKSTITKRIDELRVAGLLEREGGTRGIWVVKNRR